MSGIPVPLFQNFRHLLQIMMISKEKCRILIIITSGTIRRFRTVQWIGRTWERYATCGHSLYRIFRLTEATGGIDSLAEGCVKGACVVSCSCTDTSSSALTGRLGGSKSGPTRDVASGRCGQKELPLLGYRVLRGFQPVISSSQASSGASVYFVRSRNVLCGKSLTWSWKMDGFCVCDTAQSFLGLGKGTQVLYSTSKQFQSGSWTQ